jgi:hypothetical protein
MAISFTAGTSVEGTGSSSSTVVTLPSGLAAGDYTIIFISVNASSANITTPSGWTNILADTNTANGSTSAAHAIFYRKWQSGDGNVTVSHSSGRAAATPVKVSGADADSFVNTNGTVTQAASGAVTITAPSITPSSTVLVTSFMGRDAQNGHVLDPWTNLSAGLTKIAEANGRATGQTNAGHCIAYEIVTSGSATGTRQADASQATTGAFGVSFALKEGSSDPPGEATVNFSGSGTLTGTRVYEGDTTFDDGTIEDWTDASAGDGVVTVTDLAAHDGAFGIDAQTPTSSDKAALTKTFTGTQVARVSAWWRVTVEGSTGSNVPFARIFKGTQRLADVYRQNDSGGEIWLRITKAAGGSNYWFINTGATSEIDEWIYVEFEWNLETGEPLVKINSTTYVDATDQPTDWYQATDIDRVYLGSHENGNAGTWQMDTVSLDTGETPPTADANFSGSGTLSSTQTPAVPATGSLSGSGTLKGVGVYGSPTTTFDDGTSQDWTISTDANGVIEFPAGAAHDGAFGARSTTPATTDRAGLTKTIPSTQKARIAGWWRVTTEGGSGSNVPFARMFDNGQRLVDVYRQNVVAGANVWLRVRKADNSGYYFIATGYRLELNQWVYADFTWDLATGEPSVKIDGVEYLDETDAPVDWITGEIDTLWLGSQENGNAGVWEIDSVQVTTFSATPDLSGSGTLTGSATPAVSVTAPLSGSGTLTSSVTPAISITPNLSGSGTLSSTQTPAVGADGSLSGEGELLGEQTSADIVKDVALSGSGTLTKVVKPGFTAGMDSSSEGTLVPTVVTQSHQASALLSGSGSLTSTRTPAISKTVPLSGSGTLSAVVVPEFAIEASLSGEGTLTAQSSNSFSRDVALSGSGTLSGVATNITLSASAALSGSGTLTGASVTHKSVSANLSGSGALQVFLTAVGFRQTAPLSGSGTLSGTAVINRTAHAQLSSTGTLTRIVTPNVSATFDRISEGTLTVEAAPAFAVSAALSGVGTFVASVGEQRDYDVTAYLADRRWAGDLGSKRWEGSL